MIQMSKIQQMRTALGAEALAALAGTRGEHAGAIVLAPVGVLAELRVHGAIGERDGLTVLGSGLAGRLQAELLDSLF